VHSAARLGGPPPTRFFGRSAELGVVREALARGDRLVSLLGPGGVGKTRLALELARELGDRRVVFADLTEASGTDGACSAVARAVGVSVGGAAGEVGAVLGHELGARVDLLILDNCERAADSVAALASLWLSVAPRLSVLATSRVRLEIRGERSVELGPLAVVDAAALFVDRTQLARPEWTPSPKESLLVRDLVERLDGLPLALELAAARTRVLHLDSLLERTRASLDLLTKGPRDLPERQRTLRGAVDVSWQLLREAERAALRSAAVFRGGFSLEAATALFGTAALDLLQTLRDHSLIRAWSTGELPDELRFGLYEAVREYAAEELERSGQAAEVQGEHARFFASSAERWAEAATEQGDSTARARLAIEQDNLLAAQHWCLEHAPRDALLLSVALDAVLSRRGPPSLHFAVLNAALEHVPERTDPALRAQVLVGRARARRVQGDFAAARSDIEAALDAAKDSGDLLVQGRALSTFGLIESLEGRLREAREHFESALELFRKLGSRRWEAMSLGNLGSIHQRLGDLPSARLCYEKTLAVARELGDSQTTATCLSNLGLVMQELGQLDEARGHLEQALGLSRARGEQHAIGADLTYLGGILHEAGDLEGCERAYEEARTVLSALGDRPLEALVRALLGALWATEDRVEDARRELDHATSTLDALGAKPLAMAASVHRGQLDLALGRRAARTGDRDALARHVADASERLRAASVSESTTDEIRFARRLLSRALRELGSTETLPKAELAVGPDGRWFELAGSARVDLRSRARLRAVLSALVKARLADPGAPMGVEALMQAAWPGERVRVSAGRNRVYVAISTLRDLGLRDVLLRSGDGWLLDPKLSLANLGA